MCDKNGSKQHGGALDKKQKSQEVTENTGRKGLFPKEVFPEEVFPEDVFPSDIFPR